jgi:hypothetical protein
MRAALSIAIFASLIGCGGKSLLQTTEGAAGAPSNAGGTGGLRDPDGGMGGALSNGIVYDAGPAPSADGGTILAMGGSAALPPQSDAGPACLETSTCSVTAADAACSVDSDCTMLKVPACGCVTALLGRNKSSSATCAAPRCDEPVDCPAYFVETQDCKQENAISAADFGVACVAGRCMTAWRCGTCIK